MRRHLVWIPAAALVATAALAQPWRGGSAEARPARAAPCRADELARVRAELQATRAELAASEAKVAALDADVRRLQDEALQRARRLEAQLGGLIIETLKR